MPTPAFSLRIHNAYLRTMVREVAAQEGISQNELLEQAAENELMVRGHLIAEDLELALRRTMALNDRAYREFVAMRIQEVASDEERPDALRGYQIPSRPDPAAAHEGRAVAAFRRA